MELFTKKKDHRSGRCIILKKLSNRLAVGDYAKNFKEVTCKSPKNLLPISQDLIQRLEFLNYQSLQRLYL